MGAGSNCINLREREKWQPDSDGLDKSEKSNSQKGLGDESDLLHCDWVKGQPECTTPLLTVYMDEAVTSSSRAVVLPVAQAAQSGQWGCYV